MNAFGLVRGLFQQVTVSYSVGSQQINAHICNTGMPRSAQQHTKMYIPLTGCCRSGYAPVWGKQSAAPRTLTKIPACLPLVGKPPGSRVRDSRETLEASRGTHASQKKTTPKRGLCLLHPLQFLYPAAFSFRLLLAHTLL